MPPSKNLQKIQKKVKNKQSAMHPKSHKVQQLNRAVMRDDRINRDKAKRANAKEPYFLRIKFFKDVVSSDPLKQSYTLEEIKNLITIFINRDQEEFEKLKKDRRPGRPASNRQDQLQIQLDKDLSEYKSGYKVPDLSDPKTVEGLRNWNESIGGLNVVRIIRITRDCTELPTAA